jgi:YegS/Rv2252/BmrU family lipid kinase
MSCVLIINPAAGRRRPEASPENLRNHLVRMGLCVNVICTQRRGDAENAAKAARESGVEMVIAAGGDGTLGEVANGLAGSSIPICLIPCGTVNVMAHELGIPGTIGDACALAVEGTPRPIDAGTISGKIFLLAAGVGFDAELIARTCVRLKRKIGRLAYWHAGIIQLIKAKPYRMYVMIDSEPFGEPSHYYQALVCNTAHYAGRYRLSPLAKPDDGLLDLYLIHARGKWNLIRSLFAFAMRRAYCGAEVTYRQIRTLEILSESPAATEIDGDPYKTTPVSVGIQPSAIRIMVAKRL